MDQPQKASSTLLDHLVLAYLAFLLGLSATALATARVGIFSATASIVVASILAVVAFVWSCRNIGFSHAGNKSWIIIAIALAGGIFSGHYATSDMWGGRDPGVYMEIAGNIANQNTTDFDRPELRSGFETYSEMLTRYPGVYDHRHRAHEGEQWELVSQFNDLTPATRAVFVKTFGHSGYAIAIGFFAFSLLVFVGLTAKQMGGVMAGVTTIVLLSLSATFVYASRMNLSEPPTILYVFGFLYLTMIFQNKYESKYISFLLVAFLGLVFFSRPDGYLYGLFLSAFLFYMAILKPESLKQLIWIFGGVWVMALFAFWDLNQNSGPYLFDLTTTDRGLDTVIKFVSAVSIAALIAGALIPRVLEQRFPLLNKFRMDGTVWIGLVSVAVACAYFTFQYVSAQFVDIEEVAKITGRARVFAFQDRLAHELSWYLPIPFLALTAWGAIKLSRQDKTSWTSAFVVFSMFCLVVFIYRNMIYPDHMWATRRWLSFVIVPSCILASVATVDLFERRKVTGILAAIAALGVYSYSNTRIAGEWLFAPSQREWKAEYEKMATAIVESGAEHVFVTPSSVAGILAFQYGLPALPLAGKKDAGLDTIYENESVCSQALKSWNGNDYYRSGGMAGKLHSRCFNAKVRIIGPGFDQLLGGVTIPQGADLGELGFNKGWHQSESWGVWSRHDQGKVRIPLNLPRLKHEINSGRSINIEIKIRALIGGTLEEQPVVIIADDETLWEGVFTSPSMKTITISLDNTFVSEKEFIELSFLPEVLTTPKGLGINTDPRPLGVGLTSVLLSKAQE